MEIYKKAYAHLVGKVDEALTILDTHDLLEFDHVRDILAQALLEAEDMVITSQEPL